MISGRGGKDRAVLSTEAQGGASLALLSEDSAITLVTMPDGSSGLGIGRDGKVLISNTPGHQLSLTLSDESDLRILLGLNAQRQAGLAFLDPNGTVRVELLGEREGEPALRFRTAAGNTSVEIGTRADGLGGITVYTNDGKVLWSTPVSPP